VQTFPSPCDMKTLIVTFLLKSLDEHSQHYNIGMFGNVADTRVCAEFGP
jgi:hypothetical protein